MTPRSKNILVGFFVLGLTVGLIAFVAWLGSSAIQDESDLYLVYLEEAVAGLSVNASVRYKGVDIGLVEKIRINPQNSNEVEVLLRIKRGAPIKEDSLAILTSRGITGIQYIEISGGSQDVPILKVQEGQDYPVIKSGKSTFAAMEAAIGPILANINVAIEDIHGILKSANPKQLENILTDVRKVTRAVGDNAEGINAMIKDVRTTTDSVQKGAVRFESILSSVDESIKNEKGKVSNIINNLDQALNTLNKQILQTDVPQMSKDIKATLSETRSLVHTISRSAEEADLGNLGSEVKDTLKELQKLSQTLNRVAGDIGNQPSSLLFGQSKTEINIRK